MAFADAQPSDQVATRTSKKPKEMAKDVSRNLATIGPQIYTRGPTKVSMKKMVKESMRVDPLASSQRAGENQLSLELHMDAEPRSRSPASADDDLETFVPIKVASQLTIFIGTPLILSAVESEGFSRQEIVKSAQAALPEVKRCFESVRPASSDLQGRLDFDCEILADGKVKAVSFKQSAMRDVDGSCTCIEGVLAKIKFPPSKKNLGTLLGIGFPYQRK